MVQGRTNNANDVLAGWASAGSFRIRVGGCRPSRRSGSTQSLNGESRARDRVDKGLQQGSPRPGQGGDPLLSNLHVEEGKRACEGLVLLHGLEMAKVVRCVGTSERANSYYHRTGLGPIRPSVRSPASANYNYMLCSIPLVAVQGFGPHTRRRPGQILGEMMYCGNDFIPKERGGPRHRPGLNLEALSVNRGT